MQFKESIILYFSKQNFVRMSARVPLPLTWHICHIIVDSLGPIVSACILNQSRGHWLLSDALNFAISMSLKFRDGIDSTNLNLMINKSFDIGLMMRFALYCGWGPWVRTFPKCGPQLNYYLVLSPLCPHPRALPYTNYTCSQSISFKQLPHVGSLSFYIRSRETIHLLNITHEKTRCVSHCGLAIYIKKYLKAKIELMKPKYFTMQRYNLQKIL